MDVKPGRMIQREVVKVSVSRPILPIVLFITIFFYLICLDHYWEDFLGSISCYEIVDDLLSRNDV